MKARRATYRLQLGATMRFADVARHADALADLGISHVYLSPVLEAAPGSTHGYDVVDHHRASEALGGDEGFEAMCRELAARGLGVLVDIVPNHMAVGPHNAWWQDVLEHGRSSRYAGYFDVDWHPGEDADNRVLLPVLGERYADTLASGVLRIVRSGVRIAVHYHEHRFPVAPRSLAEPMGAAAARTRDSGFAFLADALGALPAPNATDHDSTVRRHRDHRAIESLLARHLAEQPAAAAALDDELAAIARAPSRLDAFLERQNWRIGFWRNALDELGYRRFFDVAALAGLRCERPRVFDDVHARVLGWIERGLIDGVRVDHVDGLLDPAGYLDRLRARAPSAWIVVEKILAPDERVPPAWPIDGTTGYEHLARVDGVFLDPAGEPILDELWAAWREAPDDARQARLDVVDALFASERARLVALARTLVVAEPMLRDVSARELEAAITELLVSYPVYRTYVREGQPASARDREITAEAFAAATAHRPEVTPRLWALLEDALLSDRELALRFQQTTGAVTAKGIEDTHQYRDLRLTALCEVGREPGRFATTLDELHAALAEAPPHTLLASSTHDTKRSEDVRARLCALSEVAPAWRDALARWSTRAARHRSGDLPDRPTEYLLWQTLVGAWPIGPERVGAYLEKACREAKRHTSWLRPDVAYEASVARFVEAVMADAELLDDVERFVLEIDPGAHRTSLARTLVKLAAPGVPDIYQGTEVWETSLVDPDNRRPVDPTALAATDSPKRRLVQRVLAARAAHPDRFAAPYRRVVVSGPEQERVIAFARGDDLVAVAPRWTARAVVWGETAVELPGAPGAWTDVITGERVRGGHVPVETLWSGFPVALLGRGG